MSTNRQAQILTIDDEKAIRTSFSNYLEDLDYEVLTAKDGEIGLDLFKEHDPDLVLVDLRMPKLDGLDVLEEINNISPDTPLIVVSGTGKIQDAIEAVRRGAWDYIMKPIENMSVLSHAIKQSLEKASLIEENKEYQKNLEKKVEKRTKKLKESNQKLKEINKRLQRIAETTQELSLYKSVKNFAKKFLKEISNIVNASGGSIYFIKKDGLHLAHTLDSNHVPEFIPYPLNKDTVYYHVIENKESLAVQNIKHRKFKSSNWSDYNNPSFMALPIKNKAGEIKGVISLHDKNDPPFSKIDHRTGELLASYSYETLRAVQNSEALIRSKENLRSTMENTSDTIMRINQEGKILYINSSHSNFNQRLEKGDSLYEIIPKEDRDNVHEKLTNVFNKGSHEEFEIKINNGKSTWYINKVGPIKSHGEINAATFISTEITKQKKIEQQLQKELEEKKVLLEEVHHRVKNNLNVIKSLINLQERNVSSKQEALDAFQESKSRIQTIALVHELLYSTDDFSKINMKKYINDLTRMQHRIHEASTKIEWEVVSQEVKLDLNRAIPCGLIINELITNSMKYAFQNKHSGEIRVELNRIKNGKSLELIVADNGVGFSTEMESEDSDTLGLKLIEILTDQIDGELEVQQERGTVFKIVFPI